MACRIVDWPLKYLGMPLGCDSRNSIIETMNLFSFGKTDGLMRKGSKRSFPEFMLYQYSRMLQFSSLVTRLRTLGHGR